MSPLKPINNPHAATQATTSAIQSAEMSKTSRGVQSWAPSSWKTLALVEASSLHSVQSFPTQSTVLNFMFSSTLSCPTVHKRTPSLVYSVPLCPWACKPKPLARTESSVLSPTKRVTQATFSSKMMLFLSISEAPLGLTLGGSPTSMFQSDSPPLDLASTTEPCSHFFSEPLTGPHFSLAPHSVSQAPVRRAVVPARSKVLPSVQPPTPLKNLGTLGAQWEPFVQGGVPACPESSSQARKQPSRSSALMVTAKRAQLLFASIYMVGAGGHSRQQRAGRRVTQSLGQLGKHDGEEAQTPKGYCRCRPGLQAPEAEPSGGVSQHA